MGASHPFYQRLNRILDDKKFDEYVETICEDFYAGEVGRPGLSPGIYFRLLMVGYFEGIDSERRIAWRASDSLSIRSFVRIALDECVPDHSTISRTRRLMDVETHQAVFQWVLAVLAEKGPRSAKHRRPRRHARRRGNHYPSSTFWQNLDSGPTPNLEKVMEGCAVIQDLGAS